MHRRVDCQSSGIDAEGKPCRYWLWETLSCGWNGEPGCIYQIDRGITDEDLARRERVGIDPAVQTKIDAVKSGAERIRQLWSEEMYQSIQQSFGVMDKYHPYAQDFNPAVFLNLTQLNGDIVFLHSIGLYIATSLGEAKAMKAELKYNRKVMVARKAREVRDSYRAGVRRGRPTDKTVDQDVTVDPEVLEITEAEMRAEQQVEVLEAHYEALIELVNSLKYSIQTLHGERDRVGRTT